MKTDLSLLDLTSITTTCNSTRKKVFELPNLYSDNNGIPLDRLLLYILITGEYGKPSSDNVEYFIHNFPGTIAIGNGALIEKTQAYLDKILLDGHCKNTGGITFYQDYNAFIHSGTTEHDIKSFIDSYNKEYTPGRILEENEKVGTDSIQFIEINLDRIQTLLNKIKELDINEIVELDNGEYHTQIRKTSQAGNDTGWTFLVGSHVENILSQHNFFKNKNDKHLVEKDGMQVPNFYKALNITFGQYNENALDNISIIKEGKKTQIEVYLGIKQGIDEALLAKIKEIKVISINDPLFDLPDYIDSSYCDHGRQAHISQHNILFEEDHRYFINWCNKRLFLVEWEGPNPNMLQELYTYDDTPDNRYTKKEEFVLSIFDIKKEMKTQLKDTYKDYTDYKRTETGGLVVVSSITDEDAMIMYNSRELKMEDFE